jgi:hypothetical protein
VTIYVIKLKEPIFVFLDFMFLFLSQEVILMTNMFFSFFFSDQGHGSEGFWSL